MERIILMEKPYTNYPDDVHITIVLCNWNNEYVTWLRDSKKEAYFWGHYFDTFQEALKDFNNR